jgi:hypothetical protein
LASVSLPLKGFGFFRDSNIFHGSNGLQQHSTHSCQKRAGGGGRPGFNKLSRRRHLLAKEEGLGEGSQALQAGTKTSRCPSVAMATRGLCRPGLAGPGARRACWESTSLPQFGRFEVGGPDAVGGAVAGRFSRFLHRARPRP